MKFVSLASSSLLLIFLQKAPSQIEARLRVPPSSNTDTTIQYYSSQELPRVHVRKLEDEEGGKLVGMGGTPPDDEFPLLLCEGDCDDDDDVS